MMTKVTNRGGELASTPTTVLTPPPATLHQLDGWPAPMRPSNAIASYHWRHVDGEFLLDVTFKSSCFVKLDFYDAVDFITDKLEVLCHERKLDLSHYHIRGEVWKQLGQRARYGDVKIMINRTTAQLRLLTLEKEHLELGKLIPPDFLLAYLGK